MKRLRRLCSSVLTFLLLLSLFAPTALAASATTELNLEDTPAASTVPAENAVASPIPANLEPNATNNTADNGDSKEEPEDVLSSEAQGGDNIAAASPHDETPLPQPPPETVPENGELDDTEPPPEVPSDVSDVGVKPEILPEALSRLQESSEMSVAAVISDVSLAAPPPQQLWFEFQPCRCANNAGNYLNLSMVSTFEGEPINFPTPQPKSGWWHWGWFIDDNYNAEPDLGEQILTAETIATEELSYNIIYAHFEQTPPPVNNITVNFAVCSGAESAAGNAVSPSSATTTQGSRITFPATTAASGWQFEGFYFDEGGNGEWDSETFLNITNTVATTAMDGKTIYGHFAPIPLIEDAFTVVVTDVTATYDANAHACSFSVSPNISITSWSSYVSVDNTNWVDYSDPTALSAFLDANFIDATLDPNDPTVVISKPYYVKVTASGCEDVMEQGQVTIHPRVVSGVVPNASKKFGQQDPAFLPPPLTNVIPYDPDGMLAALSNAARTPAGEHADTYDITMDSDFVNNWTNYVFDVTPGVFTIEPLDVYVGTNDMFETFSGLPYSRTTIIVFYADSNYTQLMTALFSSNLTASATETMAGSYNFIFTPALTAAAYTWDDPSGMTIDPALPEDFTFHHDRVGSLIIDKAPVTVKANNATITYGEALPKFTSVTSGLMPGFPLDIGYSCPAAGVGTWPIIPNATIPAQLDNYDVDFQNGQLRVNALPVVPPPPPEPTPPTITTVVDDDEEPELPPPSVTPEITEIPAAQLPTGAEQPADVKVTTPWSLLSLIFGILGIIGVAVSFIRSRASEEEDRRRWPLVVGLILAAASLVLLFVTQKFGGTMVVVDRWTLLFGGIALGQLILALLVQKRPD